ncbi:MAG: glycosyltransferase family 2 protein [Solirubrobacterales bacterium]|nr:MAG: glycosyltransferase family 2 protein [Solirubrobacterales bacterium]
MAPPVAIAVVSWNTRALLRACLQSISPEVAAGRVEAWVVDNASSDDSAALVRVEFPWAHLIASRSNLGFGAAVNLVAARTRSPWIGVANADVELTPGALQALVDAGARDPAVGILAPRLLLPDGSTQHSVYPFPTLAFALAFNLGLAGLSPRLADRLALEGRWNPDRARSVDWAIGAFLLVRRAAWDAVGGFDSRQWMYAEDLDLGWRAAAAGWRTRYEPAAIVRHHGAAAASQRWGEDRDAQWQRSTYAWMLRRRGASATRTFALLNSAGAGARLLLLTPRALMLGGDAWARWLVMRRWTRLHLGNLLAPRATLEHHR